MADEDPSAERVHPEVVEDAASDDVDPDGDSGRDSTERDSTERDSTEEVTHPTKLIRIASMVRGLLDEVRRAPLDDAGRRTLREIHERSRRELEEVLSPDLRDELDEVALPFTSETPSESELRIAQAQLVGWLEGLFHGIQATLFTQQVAAQSQLEEMHRQRALGSGSPSGAPRAPASGPSGYL